MGRKSPFILRVAGLASCGMLLCPLASAQSETASLKEQLQAQYEVVKTVSSTNTTVVDPGTVLTVRKGGLLGVPPHSLVLCPAKFQGDELKSPGGFCAAMVKGSSRYFSNGEKVYPTKIDVKMDKDQVSFQIMECDTCNGMQQESSYKSAIVFQFPKGTLKTASVPEIEDFISQVLAISTPDEGQFVAIDTDSTDQSAEAEASVSDAGAIEQPASTQVSLEGVRDLAVKADAERKQAQSGQNPMQNLLAAKEHSIQGLNALESAAKPEGMTDADYMEVKRQLSGMLNAALGIAALQEKNYATAQTALAAALRINPNDFTIAYPLALSCLQSQPPDYMNGVLYAVRASTLAPSQQMRTQIEGYAKSQYLKYHGTEEGWPELLKQAQADPFTGTAR